MGIDRSVDAMLQFIGIMAPLTLVAVRYYMNNLKDREWWDVPTRDIGEKTDDEGNTQVFKIPLVADYGLWGLSALLASAFVIAFGILASKVGAPASITSITTFLALVLVLMGIASLGWMVLKIRWELAAEWGHKVF